MAVRAIHFAETATEVGQSETQRRSRAHSSIDGRAGMLAKLLLNHLHNDLGKLFLLLVIQGKYHLDYLFNFRATLHCRPPIR